jgi:hypothetical protein
MNYRASLKDQLPTLKEKKTSKVVGTKCKMVRRPYFEQQPLNFLDRPLDQIQRNKHSNASIGH